MDWDFLRMGEMKWQKKEATGRKFWKHIFQAWNWLFMKDS